MATRTLPERGEMLRALRANDASYHGVFYAAVRTTGIFCRPGCPAKKPRPENVDFYATAAEALRAGYRPCKRCRPLEPGGAEPDWLHELLQAVAEEPGRKWNDGELRRLGLHPDRVRRWFRATYGMTFHAYLRSRRLAGALGKLRGGAPVTAAALDCGYESLSGFHDAFQHWSGAAPSRARARCTVLLRRVTTPLGAMIAGVAEPGLCLLEFADRPMAGPQLRRLQERLQCAYAPGDHPHLDAVQRQLDDYYAGKLRRFTVPLLTPGTAFQQRVWRRLAEIPYGATLSYSALAAELEAPDAARAVARANGDNRIAIVLPCHRVIGAGGQLTGYGGGLWRKKKLLWHENRNAAAASPLPFAAP